MKIPYFDDMNSHPKKVYRVHVQSYDEPCAEAQDAFQERFPGEDFFYPRADFVYRSRSAAHDRAHLLRFNGVHCIVIEADLAWRLNETKDEKIARLEAEVAELKRF